jgi:acetylcholinesterase
MNATVSKVFGNFSGALIWNPNTPAKEDCLYLNVWVPRTHPPYQHKAVMVWIFGGGYYSGSSTLKIYDGKYLAAENDVIVVSMNYRVGALGFLNLNTPEARGNAGMMDQRMALEWVQRNIGYFGGSPHNVTIFGESAGATSVGLHLLSPLSRGLFTRAILQSGAPQINWATYSVTEGRRRSKALARSLSCDPPDHDYSDGDIVDCLRKVRT